MKQKKILLLGGSQQQIPSIKKAKELGFYTVTCDYLPENPGHKFADEYYNVSTTDKEAVLSLAKNFRLMALWRMHQIRQRLLLHMWQKKWVYPVIHMNR